MNANALINLSDYDIINQAIDIVCGELGINPVMLSGDNPTKEIARLERHMFGMPGRKKEDEQEFIEAYMMVIESKKRIPLIFEIADIIEENYEVYFARIQETINIVDICRGHDYSLEEIIDYCAGEVDDIACSILEYAQYPNMSYEDYITSEREFNTPSFDLYEEIKNISRRLKFEMNLGNLSKNYPAFIERCGSSQNFLLEEFAERDKAFISLNTDIISTIIMEAGYEPSRKFR